MKIEFRESRDRLNAKALLLDLILLTQVSTDNQIPNMFWTKIEVLDIGMKQYVIYS